jgi:hypothetical protein
MADEDTVLEEAMDNLKEAGQRIRATQSLTRSPTASFRATLPKRLGHHRSGKRR